MSQNLYEVSSARPVFTVRQRPDGTTIAIPVGKAIEHDDGTISLMLDVVPLNGRMTVAARDYATASTQSHSTQIRRVAGN